MLDISGDPYAYGNDDPINTVDPTGLFGFEIGPVKVGDGCPLGKNPNGSCRGSDLNNVVHAVNTASSVVSGVAGLCTAAGAATVIGAGIAGACATIGSAAVAVNVTTGAYLTATGNKSLDSYAVDLGLAATGGVLRGGANASGRFAQANVRTGGLLAFLGVPTGRELIGTLGYTFGWTGSLLVDTTSLIRAGVRC